MFLLSAHRVELEVQCDDDGWSHLELTRSLSWLQRHLLVLSVETLPIRLEFLHWVLNSLGFVSALEWVPRIRSAFQTILLYHLLLGTWIPLPFELSIIFLRWSFECELLKRPFSPVLPSPLSECLLSTFSPRSMHTQGKYLVRLSSQLAEVLIDLSLKSGDIRPLLQKEILVL